MDTLSEEIIDKCEIKFQINNDFSIGCLEWVDDVLSVTSGCKNQKNMLNIVDKFAVKTN